MKSFTEFTQINEELEQSSTPLERAALKLAQSYCGMKPEDVGERDYAGMQQKLAGEIIKLVS